jgi:N-acetylmuramoyl-L-alanine amidase
VDAEPGVFGAATADAVRTFQRHRGLHDHGTCDEPTWLALVESTWQLGDRPLRLVAPHLRGDDVGDLQTALGRLGFDCGRVDGIFGPATARALAEFQRNCGVDVDGVCGAATVRALQVNAARSGTGPGVAAIRELQQLSTVGTSLRELRVVVGQFGGLGTLARHVARLLRQHGAKVITADELDPSLHAAAANRYEATVYIGLEARPDEHASVAFYATAGFQSAGGRALAERIAASFDAAAIVPAVRVSGMRLPVLRETRMTAVVCEVGPVQRVVDAAPTVAELVVAALAAWAASPIPAPA